MENINSKPDIFARYTEAKYTKFQKWLNTTHGRNVYGMFKKFSEVYRSAGHDHCGANLVGNRVRWETDVGDYTGFKINNDFLPMLARQLVVDDPTFDGFFNFHDGKDN